MKTKPSHIVILTILIFSFFIPTRTARAATIDVESTGDGTANPSHCPGAACTLRDAIAKASSGDTIRFNLIESPATINLTNGNLLISKNLSIQGPGSIDLTISGNNASRIFQIDGGVSSLNVSISGMTLTDGRVTDHSGGAIYSSNVNLTLEDLVITQNIASTVANNYLFGGGIYQGYGSLTITNSQIVNNFASYEGAGIFIRDATLTLNNVTISGNQTTWPLYGSGGGIFLVDLDPIDLTPVIATLNQTHILNNTTTSSGGGINVSGAVTLNMSESSVIGNEATNGDGGGINTDNQDAVITINTSTISDNVATGDNSVGGGIYAKSGISIVDSNLTNNSAAMGGAIFLSNSLSNVVLNGTNISGNIAQKGGGGMYFSSIPALNIFGSTINNNQTINGNGGGINYGDLEANITISTSSISGNQAMNSSGGGLYISGNTLITDSTISGNSSKYDGGGIYYNSNSPTSLTLNRVTVSGNSSTQDGGGLAIFDSGTTTITNSTISGNSSTNGVGGLLANAQTSFTLNHVTVAENSATNFVGGLTTTTSNVYMKNSILANNTGGVGFSMEPNCSGLINSQDFNLIETNDINCVVTGETTHNITGEDPLLGTLSNNGGSTLTMSLLANSPAIDSADNSSCANEDQRGYPRPQDGDSNGIANCDMGAIEVAGLPAVFSLTRKNPSPTTASTVDFIVTFTKPVINVDKNDFTLTTNGNIAGAIVSSVSGSGTNYTVTVETGSYNGSIRLDIPFSATITDLNTVSLSNLPFTSGETYIVIKSPTFSDVPLDGFAWAQIESIYTAGITGGCSTNPLNYCPNNSVTRAQMAVFLLRGIHGSAYSPPAATGTVFTDVPSDAFAAAWIEQMVAEGITSGCGNGNYCPNSTVTRAQMAVFLLRAKYGSAYSPPVATGTVFTDVPSNGFAAAFIEQLVSEGITSGCGGGNYCPNSSVTRAQMAVFLQRTFNLP